MSQPERDPEAVARALAALARSAPEPDDTLRARQGRARLLARAAASGARSPFTPSWRSGLGLPAIAALGAVALWWGARPKALAYEIAGAKAEGAYVSAPSDRTVAVLFSDETRVEVEPSSQLRVESTDPRGARILLERGSTDVHVIHRDRASWSFAAGPFEVRVTGTRFDLSWNPADQVLDLHLREGSVDIATPFGAAPVSLRAGQDFHADMRARSMTTTEHAATASTAPLEPPPAPAASNSSAPTAGAESLAPSAEAPTPTTTPSSASPNARPWSKLVASGDFAEVLREADQRGTDACTRSCSASDLTSLADAARYSGKNALASQSLLALRARFASSPSARNAAFFLGRLREQQGGASDARSWYDRYLSEAPGGTYAAEALAGKMRTTLSLEGKAAAAPIAREYLQKYPSGVYTKAARGIAGSY